MQVLITATFSETLSIREKIVNDVEIEEYGFQVVLQKRRDRRPGWAKITSLREGRFGAINIEWDSGVNLLTCRVITKDWTSPWPIVGDFITYLFERYGEVIEAVNIYPR
jgi:hypothetical protein